MDSRLECVNGVTGDDETEEASVSDGALPLPVPEVVLRCEERREWSSLRRGVEGVDGVSRCSGMLVVKLEVSEAALARSATCCCMLSTEGAV